MINLTMTWTGQMQSVEEAQTAWNMLQQAVSGLPVTSRTEIIILVEEDATL